MCLLKMGYYRILFQLFSLFSSKFTIFVDLGRIRTQVAGVESEQADHMTATTAQTFNTLYCSFFFKKMGHTRPLFYFRLFNTQLTVNKCSI